MKRKITYRPSKAQSVFGGVVGVIFVLIGLFVAIPQAGLFGLFWTGRDHHGDEFLPCLRQGLYRPRH